MEKMQSVKHETESRSERSTPSNSLAGATPLQQDILRVLSYFDIFQHPLTAEEIYSFLPSNSTSVEKIIEGCSTPPINSIIFQRRGYYTFTTATDKIIQRRKEKERRALMYRETAEKVARFVRYVPFVRGVYLSGELSKDLASEHSDIDFFIITAKHRLWICRSFFPILKRLLPKQVKRMLCFNTFVSEQRLTFEDQSIYAAIEIATLKPLVDEGAFIAFLEQNSWITRFLPNVNVQTLSAIKPIFRKPAIQLFYDYASSISFFTYVDRWLLRFWKIMIRWKFSQFPDHEREKLFICKEYLGTGYSQNHAKKILDSYRERLFNFQLTP